MFRRSSLDLNMSHSVLGAQSFYFSNLRFPISRAAPAIPTKAGIIQYAFTDAPASKRALLSTNRISPPMGRIVIVKSGK